jgi:hypothetical protein
MPYASCVDETASKTVHCRARVKRFDLHCNYRGSAPVNRGQAAFSASNSHRGFLPRHLGISAGGTGKLSISSIDQR